MSIKSFASPLVVKNTIRDGRKAGNLSLLLHFTVLLFYYCLLCCFFCLFFLLLFLFLFLSFLFRIFNANLGIYVDAEGMGRIVENKIINNEYNGVENLSAEVVLENNIEYGNKKGRKEREEKRLRRVRVIVLVLVREVRGRELILRCSTRGRCEDVGARRLHFCSYREAAQGSRLVCHLLCSPPHSSPPLPLPFPASNQSCFLFSHLILLCSNFCIGIIAIPAT